MPNQRCLLSLTIALCLAILASCSIDVFPGGNGVSTPLDQADATVTITQQASGTEAAVVARVTDSRGRLVELDTGQALSVNGTSLTGPDARGQYTQTVAAAGEYTVTVNEPTVGVSQTTITVPGAFAIAAPTAGATVSLSGFAINWSNADPALQIKVTITQTIFGAERTQTFGPFTDTGSLTLDNQDLRSFQQGANLIITLTKIRERVGINGFKSATLSSQLWQSVAATPGP